MEILGYPVYLLQSLHGKLQAEKSKLALAVQACEDATASISRPSSPKDSLPPPVPIQELECRARLEDLIDQVNLSLVRFLNEFTN